MLYTIYYKQHLYLNNWKLSEINIFKQNLVNFRFDYNIGDFL